MSRPALLWLVLVLLAAAPRAGITDTIEAGKTIYRTATRPDGSAVAAVVQQDVPLPAAAAACANCHRRSGLGISEGGSRSLNVTAPALFNASDKPPLRPAYNDQTLVRAIVAGIDSGGRELHVNMPRYELTAEDAAALTGYLHSLAATAPDGISDTDLVVATIIAPDAQPHEADAVTRVLQKFVEIKNAETRHESERAAASARNYYGRSRQRAFRTWRLHVWRLEGPAKSWQRQLESLYGKDKPFAILSGALGDDVAPIHAFCETSEVPCVLPLGGSPLSGETGFYSLYFTAGAILDARVTAAHIVQSGIPTDTTISVLHTGDARSKAALHALNAGLAAGGYERVRASRIGDRPVSARKWRSLLDDDGPNVVIAWVATDALQNLPQLVAGNEPLPQFIYTAETFSHWQADSMPAGFPRDRIRHVYPYSLPGAGQTQFPREYLWLRQHGLADLDPVSASSVLFACRVLGVGLADIQNSFSREYLLESLEHAMDGTQLTSVYPRTSLGPDQRLLSRGAYVVGLPHAGQQSFTHPAWIQP